MDDLEGMHAVLSNPIATRYWSTPPHADIELTREWMESMVSAAPGESDDFLVEHDGRVIGKAGFWRLPEIGFILHPDQWGQGFAFEALSAVIGHVFDAHAIPAAVADVDPRNRASLRLLGKLGFREVRREKKTWNVGGRWCDSVFLELARPEG